MRSLAHSLVGRGIAISLVALTLWPGCGPARTLAPTPGVPQYQQGALVAVPGGFVNAAGGNLILERVDLSIDTVLGTREIRAVYHSATGAWWWSFDTTYDGDVFVDPGGARFDVSDLADGEAIPGTWWVKVDGASIATKGGLVHHFDANGRLESVRFSTLAWPRIEYVESGFVTEVSQCLAQGVCLPFYAIVRDAAGRVQSVTDARTGRRAEYVWDGLGRLERARSALDVERAGAGTRYEYQALGTLLTAIDTADGERIEYAYGGGRRIRDVVQVGEGDPAHRFLYYRKDEAELYPTVHTDPLGARTRYAFDAQRRLHRLERLDSDEISTWTWDGVRVASETTPAGVTTHFTWTEDDLVATTHASGNVTYIEYEPGALHLEDPFSRPRRRIHDDLGPIEERFYDAEGRLVEVRDGEGDAVGFGYEGLAVASITPPVGAALGYPNRGVHGHWLDSTGAIEVHRAFDLVGNELAAPGGLQAGGVLTRAYDAGRHLASVRLAATDADRITSEGELVIERRFDGRPLRVRRPGGADHALDYDAVGRLVAQRELVDGVWYATTFEYDAAGRPTATNRPNGMREERGFDPYGRLVRLAHLRDGSLESEALFAWFRGQVVESYDSVRDETQVFFYDAAGRPAATIYGHGESLTLEYDARSRLSAGEFSLPGGPTRRIEYTRDLADRQIQLSTDGGEVLLARELEGGRLVTASYGNGLERHYEYDDQTGWFTGATAVDAAGAIVEETTVVRELRSAPARLAVEVATTTPLAATREEYGYAPGSSLVDPEQLVGKRVFHYENETGEERRFVYDELSNLRSNGEGDVFEYDTGATRLLSATFGASGQTLDYTYDEAGFATSRAGVPIAWTAAGNLASYGPIELEWDAIGRLVSATVAGVTREFGLFGGRVEMDAATGAVGALDLGAVSLGFASEARLYRHRDFRGNVSWTSDETGAVVSHLRYGPYGLDAVFGSADDAIGFAGGMQLGPLALVGERVYDPAVGRFLSPDPVPQLVNQYAYTLGDPVRFWDPGGLLVEAGPLGPPDVSAEILIAVLVAIAATIDLLVKVGVIVPPLAPVATAVAAGLLFFAAVLALAILIKRAATGGQAPGLPLPDTGSGPCRARCGPPRPAYDACPGGCYPEPGSRVPHGIIGLPVRSSLRSR